MKVSLEEKKIEAIERMKILNVSRYVINLFENSDCVCISESAFGLWSEMREVDKKRVADFEKINSALVYLIIRGNYQELGMMDSYLYVSDYKDEEWELDREDLKHGQVLAYVYNHDEPMFSEFGAIGVKTTRIGGVTRIW